MPSDNTRLTPRMSEDILEQFRSLPFWRDFEQQLSVGIVGSVGAGLSDAQSDLDVYVYVPQSSSMALYEMYKKGYEDGSIDVINPKAFQFDEYPMVELEGYDGHYRLMVIDSIEENVRNYVDVDRWVCLNSIPLHDPSGRLEYLRKLSAHYPSDVLNRKLVRHYWLLRDYFFSIKKPLDRAQREVLSLLCVQGISHLLKFCILAEDAPFPYDKWLYRVATDTSMGKKLRHHIDALFDEIHRKEIGYEKPKTIIRPGHRNEQYEHYRIYHIVSEIRKVFEENMPELRKDKGALRDRIGAWKPR